MSSSGGQPGPGYEVDPYDTEHVYGNPGPAGRGTQQYQPGTDETSGTNFGGGTGYDPKPPPVTPFETSASNGGVSGPVASTALSQTLDTTQPGTGGIPLANPPYRVPGQTAPGETYDTTRTDVQPGGSETNPVPASYEMTGTTSTYNIGAEGTDTGESVPATPTGVQAVSGSRTVLVSWEPVADVADDPTLGYVVLADDGGTAFAAADATSVEVDWLDLSRTYTFRVAARNKAGLGAYSEPTEPVRAYNPDAPDPLRPEGITEENLVNPIYRPDGTFVAGTGGTNSAPTDVTATAGAAGSLTVTVSWTAPTAGQAPTGYTVTASDGTSVQAAGDATSADLLFAEAGAEVTATAQATNDAGPGAVSAPSNSVTVP